MNSDVLFLGACILASGKIYPRGPAEEECVREYVDIAAKFLEAARVKVLEEISA